MQNTGKPFFKAYWASNNAPSISKRNLSQKGYRRFQLWHMLLGIGTAVWSQLDKFL